jgi:hypothetical protein
MTALPSKLVAKAVRPNELHEYVRHECDHSNRVSAPCVRVYEAAEADVLISSLLARIAKLTMGIATPETPADLSVLLLRLANAADAVGVKHFDTDWLTDEVQEMQNATLVARSALKAKPEPQDISEAALQECLATLRNAQKTSASVDTHDYAGMAAWLRERARVNREFAANPPDPHTLEQWQRNVMPHLAFRFEQAAIMIESLQAGCSPYSTHLI